MCPCTRHFLTCAHRPLLSTAPKQVPKLVIKFIVSEPSNFRARKGPVLSTQRPLAPTFVLVVSRTKDVGLNGITLTVGDATLVHLKLLKQLNEQQHDKTNKVSVRPAKTQISLGIHLV